MNERTILSEILDPPLDEYGGVMSGISGKTIFVSNANCKYSTAGEVGPIQGTPSLSKMDEGGAGKNYGRWHYRGVKEWVGSTFGIGQKEGWITKILCELQKVECLDKLRYLPHA